MCIFSNTPMPSLATTKGIEVALITRLESNVDLENLGHLLDDYGFSNDRVPHLIKVLRFLLSPAYKNISSNRRSKKPLLYGSLAECIFRNFGKGFFVATWATALLDALPLLLRGKFAQAGRVMFVPIHLQHGLAFGLFVSIFNTTLYVVSLGTPEEMEEARKKNAWLAGLLAGASVVFAPKPTRYFTAQLTALRSLEVLARLAYNRAGPKVQKILDVSGIGHNADTATMMFASTVVLKDVLEGGENIEKGYLKFLRVQAGHNAEQICNLNRVVEGTTTMTSCQVVHPRDESCTKYWGGFFVDAYIERALPMYTRVFAVPLFLSFLQGQKPQTSLMHFAKGVGQSSLFLAFYCTLAWSSMCMMKECRPSFRRSWGKLITGILAGSTLLIEKKGRRIEVALFVLSQAIAILLNKSGIKFPSHADSLVAMASCSFLMHAYLNEVDLIRPGYRFLLERFLDSRTDRHASIIPRVLSKPLATQSP